MYGLVVLPFLLIEHVVEKAQVLVEGGQEPGSRTAFTYSAATSGITGSFLDASSRKQAARYGATKGARRQPLAPPELHSFPEHDPQLCHHWQESGLSRRMAGCDPSGSTSDFKPMRNPSITCLLTALLALCDAGPAFACFFGCRPGEAEARAVMDHLLAARFSAPYKIVEFHVLRTADFDILVGEIRGYEIFYKATVEFPQGAHPDCEPAKGAARPDDCSDDSYFSLVRETRPKPGRQFIEAGGRRSFDEDFRFAEGKSGWRGPDGQSYEVK